MDTRTVRDAAAAVAAGGAVLLLVDLSLGWHGVTVSGGGLVDVSATSSGWAGPGLVAGLLAIALLVSIVRPLRRDGAVDEGQAATTALIALAAAGFTIGAALTGSVSINAPGAAVQVGSRLWPAYAGIALAAAVALAAAAACALVLAGATSPARGAAR